MRVLVSAVSAKMGGAENYLKNIARELARRDSGAEFIFVVPGGAAAAIQNLNPEWRVIATDAGDQSWWRRLWFDQVILRRTLKTEKVEVLYSTANFGMLACPCRQVLLVRNPLYFSPHYLQEILPRKGFRARVGILARRWLNCVSARSADIVITPSQSMMDDVRQFVDIPAEKAVVNHYGVDAVQFHERGAKERGSKSKAVLLFPGLYAEHKNMRTLFKALIELVESGCDFRLVTPADPNWEGARWTYTWKEDSQLASDSRIKSRIQFTGVRKTDAMPELYSSADVMVYPCVVESFGHPLLEGMAAGLPIVAADVAINRELCADAAIYFSPFDADDFCAKLLQVLRDPALRSGLIGKGLQRSRQFQWECHVERLVASLRKRSGKPSPAAA
jgi:glycosyltransferase involved in cell wall biosynthesis